MNAFDLEQVYLSLNRSGSAVELPGADFMERLVHSPADMAYLVSITHQDADWPHWERHPKGDEVLVMLEGRLELVLDVDGVESCCPFSAGQTVVVPAGAWHRARVLEPGRMLALTYGEGTDHRPLT